MSLADAPAAFEHVGRLAALPWVHAAFHWFHLHERRLMHWQRELVSIAAPPFGERARAEWLAARFAELGLAQVEIDAVGNVSGLLCGRRRAGDLAGKMAGDLAEDRRCVMLSAHIDTVFPAGEPIDPVLERGERRLVAPGACDNGAGVTALLALAAALQSCAGEPAGNILFVGNVGEEGDGDLRGARYLFGASRWRESIAANLVLDGAGCDTVVTEALGSRRFLVSILGPGGHSWTDAGAPNPIVAASRAISALSEVELPCEPRTTLNFGVIEGGTSINSIPESASVRIDLRSVDAGQLVRLEAELRRNVDAAIVAANAQAERRANGRRPRGLLRHTIRQIGSRPAGRLPAEAPLLQSLLAVDRRLGIRTQERIASTDANIPLSLCIPALSLGAGGEGGGIHTRGEWYDSSGRELALKRILLLLLAAADHLSGSRH